MRPRGSIPYVKKIKQISLRHPDHPAPSISVSIGIAQFPEHGNSTEVLLRAADDALYASKLHGRDRITVYSPSGASL
ncbi:GGDEF domain-containing protein [Aquicella siphonis]|uniref:GGDEF domain-containing protein n=1 Tax=Aquicella siphonis TaxID=254247 RepID=UPI0038B90A69